MLKCLSIILFLSIYMGGCTKHNHIDFSSSEAFFSSLNKTKITERENIENTSKLNNLKKNKLNNLKKSKINNIRKPIIKLPLILTLSSYQKQLKQKIGSNEFEILKIFNSPSLKIEHGKVKNFQFHLDSCHLDLFFLNDRRTYTFKHFDIRPSSILSNLDQEKCFDELNKKFTLIHDPK